MSLEHFRNGITALRGDGLLVYFELSVQVVEFDAAVVGGQVAGFGAKQVRTFAH